MPKINDEHKLNMAYQTLQSRTNKNSDINVYRDKIANKKKFDTI